MNITLLPSGSYRIRETVKGKTYSVTVDHKPKGREAHLLLAEKMKEVRVSPSMPLKTACKAYIESKSNVLSPSSIRGYMGQIRAISEKLSATPINMITTAMLQTEVNEFSLKHSPKTVSNQYGFIVSVLKFYGIAPGKVTLPQKEKKTPYIPTEEEVHKIFAYVKDSPYEIPILLSAMSLRRSEILALTIDDLTEDNRLIINKAKVQNENKEWVIKPTKTTDSTRSIVVPDYIANKIRQQGYVFNGFPGQIYKHLIDAQNALGIPHFSLHKMRHFFASYMHKLGYSDKQIQEAGGWKTTQILDTVYKHAMDLEEAKRSMSTNIEGLL
jgi:integrase